MAKWRPAAFTAIDVVITSWVLSIIAGIRGVDYLRSRDIPLGPSLALVERSFPIVLWGSWFCAGAGILMMGLITRRHFIVWAGYATLFVGYTLLAVGLVVPFLPADIGARTGAQTLYVGLVHFLLMIRTGAVPLKRSESSVVATIQAVD